ncbi:MULTISPECIES: class II lanthipeptide, LchA2/BrtA2 family [unclassified Lysinibacillus]|uniref:class II lanthipeptide, LchA2/BrtA2 family n=1 Tax=unclassified Lysinibacillus TaxID=2636778 RepID=UPI0020116E64|nr:MULTISPECIES: class II lanthipeptide, LchA2/BrtA2 family [unclassified Lysinibacillus]MCL1695629.1 class II lanthipeptide, LchA2/BrtA2 family [Lysinibacillus sp. BPa_S21]MCL1700126.1 class II lanthipeptide, LchA2/BrtA2 family [Lysinibacillus sp. Bpr_S20]
MESNLKFDAIGEINEEELKSLSGAGEVNPRSSWGCVVQVTIYTISDSMNSCPSTACSTRCGK